MKIREGEKFLKDILFNNLENGRYVVYIDPRHFEIRIKYLFFFINSYFKHECSEYVLAYGSKEK